jgi:hypothetical protein
MRSVFTSARRVPIILAVQALTALGMVAFATPSGAATMSIPPHPAFQSSDPFGIWQTGPYDVYNNEWNTKVAGPQTIWADSHSQWGVESTQSDTTEVKVYPSVQWNYSGNGLPVGNIGALHSWFRESMPSVSDFDAEAAYDLWFNNNAIEVMVWLDNHGQRPAGNIIARTRIYGQKFAVWQGGPGQFSFALTGKQETHGRVHLLSALRWLVNHGHMSPSDVMTQVGFGWEIASTDGKPMDFTVTRYSLTTVRKG